MRKWECIVCGWVYDEEKGLPEEGIPAGTRWEDVAEDFLCPDCGVGKEDFELIEDSGTAAAQEAEAETLPVVVIGTGLAGYNFAREFRKYDANTPLQMISADDGRFYSKPMLSTGFSRGVVADDLATASAAEMEQQLHAEILCFREVVKIDTAKHMLSLSDDTQLPYSRLVLAWGAEAIRPPLTGNALERVYSINSLLDYARFRDALQKYRVRRLLIIGAGLIGSEFANDLYNGGFEIEVVDPLGYSLPTLLPEAGGKAVQEALEEHGVRFHFGTVVERIDFVSDGDGPGGDGPDGGEPEGGGVVATLRNGTEVRADLVVSAVGVRPRTALAQKSGIAVNRGIVVDRYLRSSAQDVYALGDCAEVGGLVLFYVAPLMACARALARTLGGEPTEVQYPGMPVTIKTPLCPVVVAPPPRDAEGTWNYQGEEHNIVAEFRDAEQCLRGFALTGEQGIRQKLRLQKELPPMLSPTGE